MEGDAQTRVPGHSHTKPLSIALDCRDRLTRLHCDRVLGLATALGVRCGLSSDELEVLELASLFHDIGKIGVADSILRKTGRLDPAEWAEMKQHPGIGERIMSAIETKSSPQAARAIRHHHEHFDGRGYPDGLAGEAIPIAARIVAIADSYDAMSETRSYHLPKTHSQIMTILEAETGGKHDPELMRIFFSFVESSEFTSTRA